MLNKLPIQCLVFHVELGLHGFASRNKSLYKQIRLPTFQLHIQQVKKGQLFFRFKMSEIYLLNLENNFQF